jgi:uncharacterized protein Veg
MLRIWVSLILLCAGTLRGDGAVTGRYIVSFAGLSGKTLEVTQKKARKLIEKRHGRLITVTSTLPTFIVEIDQETAVAVRSIRGVAQVTRDTDVMAK